MYRLQSRPRFALLEGDGKGTLSLPDYDSGFITKYADAYQSEITSFLRDVQQGTLPDDVHSKTCVRAMWMVQMATKAAQSRKEIHHEMFKQS